MEETAFELGLTMIAHVYMTLGNSLGQGADIAGIRNIVSRRVEEKKYKLYFRDSEWSGLSGAQTEPNLNAQQRNLLSRQRGAGK